MSEEASRDCEFGFPGPLRDRLVAAVLRGEKTATSSLLLEWQLEDEPLPKAGERQKVIDSAGAPVAVIEIVSVEVIRLADARLDSGTRGRRGVFERRRVAGRARAILERRGNPWAPTGFGQPPRRRHRGRRGAFPAGGVDEDVLVSRLGWPQARRFARGVLHRHLLRRLRAEPGSGRRRRPLPRLPSRTHQAPRSASGPNGLGKSIEAVGRPGERPQIGLNGWIADSPDSATFLRALIGCEGDLNLSSFCDPRSTPPSLGQRPLGPRAAPHGSGSSARSRSARPSFPSPRVGTSS